MKRIPAVMAAVAASAALATATIGAAGTPPAAAAPNPHTSQAKTVEYQIASLKTNHTGKRVKPARAAKTAKPAKTAKAAKAAKAAKPADPVKILSQYNSGQYVTVVTCHGTDTPAPVHLNLPHTPLQVKGDIPTPAIIHALAQPRTYKKVYTCTVTVEQKLPAPARHVPHHVTVNTGFGGRANSVVQHHPVH
jgi:hypothetical protein